MTWLDVPPGATDWDRLSDLFPAPFAALAEMVEAAWDGTDAELLELARLRIAALLGNTAELARPAPRVRLADKEADLARWPTSPLFTPKERACLALVEQFVLDANGVTDRDVEAVTEHLGAEGCYAFVAAVSVLETYQRGCLTLGIASLPDDRPTLAKGAS